MSKLSQDNSSGPKCFICTCAEPMHHVVIGLSSDQEFELPISAVIVDGRGQKLDKGTCLVL